MLMGSWILIFKSEFCGSFLHIRFCFCFFLGLCRHLVGTEWDETASESNLAGEVSGTQHQPQRSSGDAGVSLSHWNAIIYHIHIVPGNPWEGTLALEDNSPGALVAFGGQHFTDYRLLWWDDSLSLTSTRVLCTVVQQEVEDRCPVVVLKSHYRQTEQK